MTIAVLLALQRSGTRALGSIIDQHPNVNYAREVFHPRWADVEPNYFGFLKTLIEEDVSWAFPDRAPEQFRRYVSYLHEKSTKEITVIDVKYASTHHFEMPWKDISAPPNFLYLLVEHGLPVIHLTRKNLLRVIVSTCFAEVHNVYHVQDAASIPREKISIAADSIVARLSNLTFETDRMARLLAGYPNIATIDYAELFESGHLSNTAESRICQLLSISAFQERKPKYLKQVPHRLEYVIKNYDEIARTLRPTQFAWMLEAQ